MRRFVDDAPVALAMLDAATYRGRRHYDLFPEPPDHHGMSPGATP